MIIIGEKINGTRREVAAAIEGRDAEFIRSLAREQLAGGAHFLDVNAGTHPDREPEDMAWLVETVQSVGDARLCCDSANPAALLAGIQAAARTPMLNSLSGEEKRIQGVLPLACRNHTELVVLALDDHGIPVTTAARMDIIRRLIGLARGGGMDDERLYIDPLVTTIATDNRSGVTAFETIRRIREEFPRVHITCGLSNISFGQPSRTVINQAFAALAVGAGLDSAIMDPCDRALRSCIYAAEMVLGLDPDCQRYSQAHRSGLIGAAYGSASGTPDIEEALAALVSALEKTGLSTLRLASRGGVTPPSDASDIPSGVEAESGKAELEELVRSLVTMKKQRVRELTELLLQGGAGPLAVLDASRRAMAEVGRLFEEGEYFVPELILAGRMLSEIAEMAKPHLLDNAGPAAEKKGRVLLGTVEGDIHDIGKDIVKTMLEINGFEVLDLGVDVPKDRFIEAAREFQPQVVALSGFLTLAFDPMRETIADLKALDIGPMKYMIGGGQIDDYVKDYTGADAYGRDAMEAVKLCQRWIG